MAYHARRRKDLIVCELFAINSAQPQDATSYLPEFFSHSVYHPDGWGMAWRDASGIHLHKEPIQASTSPWLSRRLRKPLMTRRLLAHIRKASKGRLAYENCHPFLGTDIDGNEWMMIHNGSLFNDSLTEYYDGVEQGDTDSETLLLYMLDILEQAAYRAGSLSPKVRFDALSEAVAILSNHNKLNLVMDDGTYTYVHTNTARCTLMQKRTGGAVVISTQALDARGWEPVPPNRLIAYRDGELVRQAVPHASVYTENHYDLAVFLDKNSRSVS